MGHGAYVLYESIEVTRVFGLVVFPVEVLLAGFEVGVHVDPAVGHIDGDDVAVLDKSERAHKSCLGRDIAD